MISLFRKGFALCTALLCVVVIHTTSVHALSIDAASSSYQITSERAPTPTPKTTVPKTVIKPTPQVAIPKVTTTPTNTTSVKNSPVRSTAPLRAAAPTPVVDGKMTGIVLSHILQTLDLASPLRIANHIRVDLTTIADASSSVHASAREIDTRFLSFLQMIGILAFILFAFGLGLISAPLKR